MHEPELKCTLDPNCEWPAHAASDHPCGRRILPGDPCRYCGGPQEVVDGMPQSCSKCWVPATIADLKAIAAEAGLETTVTTP